jgi:hypothetical protein
VAQRWRLAIEKSGSRRTIYAASEIPEYATRWVPWATWCSLNSYLSRKRNVGEIFLDVFGLPFNDYSSF